MSGARALLLAVLAGGAAIGPASAADHVTTRAGTHEHYGRIAFDWPEPVTYETSLEGATLTLRFGRPLETDLAAITRVLANYVGRASLDGAGTTLTLALKRPITANAFIRGNTVAVDLVEIAPTPAPASPAAAPTATSAKPKAAKAPVRTPIGVRVAERPGYRRLTLASKSALGATFGEESGDVSIHFAHAVSIDQAKIEAALPDTQPQLAEEAGGTTLTLHLPEGVRLRHIKSGNSLLVDLLSEKPAGKAEIVPPVELIEPAAGPVDIPLPPKPAPPAHASTGAPQRIIPLPPARPAAPTLAVRYAASDEAASLRFPWSVPVGAAVFRRAGVLWVVFGARATADFADVTLRGKAAVERMEQVADPAATVLRVVTRAGLEPSIRRVDNDWVLDLKAQDARPDLSILVDAEPAARRVVFEMRDAGDPVILRDPEVGDRLIVVPTREVGRGLGAESSAVDFRGLVSVQGLVLRPNRDGVTARRQPNGIEVTGPEGLTLSPEADRVLGPASASPRLFDFGAWRGPAGQSFLSRRSELERAVAAAAAPTRSRPRLALARFYFANLFAAETLGVLEAIERDDPTFAADRAIRAMKGAAFLMNGDRQQAAHELGQATLDNEPEAELWRGSLAMKSGDVRKAADEFAKGAALIADYPPTLRNRFALEIAEALIRTDQAEAASPLLRLVLKEEASPGERSMARFLEGLQAQHRGQLDRALETWQGVAIAGDRVSRARALEARAVAMLDAGKISRSVAIQQLDGLRFAWRGDQFEFDLLTRLGTWLIEEGDYRRGLDTLRQATINFPDHPGLNEIHQQMAAAFSAFFLGKDAAGLSPLKALALYDEFKELMPPGEKGDTILAGLIDRLIAVDLLDRADGLLEERVSRLPLGPDKARAATRLAMIRLIDRRPEPALAALDIAVGDTLPPELARQRQQARARALSALGRADEALAAIAADTSRDADRLRADVYWKAQNWPEATAVFARLVDPPDTDGKLPQDQARLVLDWAAALTLAGDQPGLAKLRASFGGAMAASPYAESFRVVAGDEPSGAAAGDPRERARRVAQIADLQSFAARLKERLSTEKAGATN